MGGGGTAEELIVGYSPVAPMSYVLLATRQSQVTQRCTLLAGAKIRVPNKDKQIGLFHRKTGSVF